MVAIDVHARTELADQEFSASPLMAIQAAGPVQVVPLHFVLAVAVEYLHAMVLAIGYVHPALGVGDDVVDDVELSRVGAGLTPGEHELPVGRILVHARVAVTVRDVELS